MAQYTVKAPDGKTLTISGPDGASQEDVIAQAQALYKPSAAAPAPAPKPARPSAQPNQYLDHYNTIRNNLAKGETDPKQRQVALNRFDSDPRAQRLRQLAGLAPLSTAKQEVQQTARQRMQQGGADIGKNATGFQSGAAGIAKGMFGIPEVLAAAGERFLPSSLTGNRTNASFSNILQMIRSKDQAAIDANPGAGLAGELGGGIVGAGAAGKLLMGGARAASAVPVVGRAARAIEAVGTLRKGQKVRNAAKLVTTGAAAGAAQATGEGNDPITGAVYGAAAVPVVGLGFKGAQVLTRPFRDVMRLSSAGQILSRLTTATRDAMETRAAQYRADTGAEPTLFELLPLADRNKILKTAVVGKDNVVEAASNAIRARGRNLGPEMSRRAQEILQPGRDFVEQGINRDMRVARSRAHPLAPPVDDAPMIADALDSPTNMHNVRDTEAQAIMAPHENTHIAANAEDLHPQVPNPSGGTGVSTDPEVETVIRNAAGLIRRRMPGAGITAGDVTDIISRLRPMLGNGGNDAMVAQRAINHLHDVLDNTAPAAGQAAREMSDAYAARSRMMEGMQEGEATRLRDEIQVGTSRTRARTVRNAYDTPEGAAGRTLGQGNRIIRDLGGSPEEALRATVGISRNSTGRQIAQNVGDTEAEAIGRAARAQDESAQALASASNKAQSGGGEAADVESLVQAIAGLHPSSFITTKAGAMRRLLDMTYIPETRARTMVDMIFSQDPAMRARALRAIGNEPNGAGFLKSLVGGTSAMASSGLPDDAQPEIGATPAPPPTSAAPDQPPAAEEPAQDDGQVVEAGDSPYRDQLQTVYDNENPDLIDLVQRVKHQESHGDQHAVSSAGAVGIMQVMPDTAPEAATLAGLPWDAKAYRNDAAYNELLGIAYLSSLLHKYDGDVAKALAAYNAGPGRADEAMASGGDNWIGHLPAETQDYVARVG